MAGERRTPYVVVRTTGVHGDLHVSKASKKKGGPSAGITNQKDDLVPLDLTDRLLSFSFDDSAKMADKATLSLDNFDLSLLDDASFKPGIEIEVAWGYRDELTEPRKLIITGLKGWHTLNVEALGEVLKMDRQAKGRHFESMTRSAIVRQIADEYGFGTDSEIEDTEIVLPSVTQPAHMTDAQFIAGLARKEKFQFYVRKSGLHFHKKDFVQAPVRKLVYYNGVGSGDVMSIDYEEDTKGKKGSVATKGRDPIAKTDIKGKADKTTEKGRPTLGSTAVLYDVEVDQKTGQKARLAPTAQLAVKPTSATTEKEAQRSASNDFRGEQHFAIKLKVKIIGDPNLTARKIVQMAGIGKRLSGPYYVDKCDSRIGSSGYEQTLELHRDTHNGYGEPKADVKAEGVPNKKDPKGTGTTLEVTVNQKTGEKTRGYKVDN